MSDNESTWGLPSPNKPESAPRFNREAWLTHVMRRCVAEYDRLGFETTPAEQLRISVGWPWCIRKGSHYVTAQCWRAYMSQHGYQEIFITPRINDELEVVQTVAHEVAHTLQDSHGHGPKFARAARAIGLLGPPKHTHAGPAFIKEVCPRLVRGLGAYPHGILYYAWEVDA